MGQWVYWPDQRGEVYIIETKLYMNPTNDWLLLKYWITVSISENPDHLEDFKQAIEGKIFAHFKLPFNDKLSQFFELVKKVQVLIDRFHQNLFDGKFRFVVLMDGIEQRLKDLISFRTGIRVLTFMESSLNFISMKIMK